MLMVVMLFLSWILCPVNRGNLKVHNAEAVSRKIRQAFGEFPNWRRSESALRELRKKVTFALFAETDDLDRVTAMVDDLFTLLERSDRA